MSTPSETPPSGQKARQPPVEVTDAELFEQMQHMVDLQYEQQRLIQQEQTDQEQGHVQNASIQEEQTQEGNDDLLTTIEKPAAPKQTQQDATTKEPPHTTAGAGGSGSKKVEQQVPPIPPPRRQHLPRPSDSSYESGVGQGTLIWNSETLGRNGGGHSSNDTDSSVATGDDASGGGGGITATATSGVVVVNTAAAAAAAATTTRGREPPPAASADDERNTAATTLPKSAQPFLSNLAGYGSISTSNDVSHSHSQPPPPPPPAAPTHEYHYGNPDLHNPYDTSSLFKSLYNSTENLATSSSLRRRRTTTSRGHQPPSFFTRLRNCLSQFFWGETPLHRSFCYGAIDGMLTGAGIVSTFCGMHLLSINNNNSPQIRALVVAFTAATCFADSVCMAIGHVWTTHVLAASQAQERSAAREQLDQDKADAKGLLVDLLLSKGMLKIDAMSLADTLEGYPDLFVSTMIGESLLHSNSQAGPRHDHHLPDTTHDEGHLGADQDFYYQDNHPRGHNSNHHFPSYGRLTEIEMDGPEAYMVQSATSESRKESIFMMLGFSLFAVVPSLIYTWVPAVMLGNKDTAGGISDDDMTIGGGINPNTLVISLTAIVMWCLGVWKSRFLDSNWLVFGIETVLVLLICILCAYGLGALLNKLFLPEDYLLEVKQPVTKAETIHTTISSSSSGIKSSSYSNPHDF